MPRLRLRVSHFQCSSPLCCFHAVHLAIRQGTAYVEPRGCVVKLTGGWQLSAIVTDQSGQALDTGSWGSPGTGFSVSNRLNCVSGVDPVFPNPDALARFNPAAFTDTVVPQFGNCARNNLIGPKQVNFDFSAIKDFRLAERQTLQFRTKMFNAPYHVELGSPATGWGNSNVLPQATFGTITSTRRACARFNSLRYNF